MLSALGLANDFQSGVFQKVKDKMGVNVKGIGAWWMVSLLSVASFAATSGDLRLVEATEKGDKELVRSLLKEHADVNTPQADGATALAWAAYRDDLESADLLIGAGANVNSANDYGVTPLSLACANGSAAMVDRLLKAGADANASVLSGETALMRCARTGNVEAVKLLLARGADVKAKENREGQTALMWAVAANHPEVARVLIEREANANARAKSGFTPLMFAAQQGDMDSARMLLAAGANVNDATNGEAAWPGDTALLVASASGHEALAIYLLDHDADPNAADENGFTALHFAVLNGLALVSRVRIRPWAAHLARPNMMELAKALLAHGANPNARVKKAAGADKIYRITNAPPMPGSVSPVGATAFLMAALTYDANLMRILADGGANPLLATEHDEQTGGNITPLMAAAGLIRWRNARTPLTEEQELRAVEAVKVAVELGADVNATNDIGMTALHGAAFNGSNRIIQFLAEKGANLDAKDKAGQTPLHKALNIKPPGVVIRNLIPVVAWKSTADLLLKLGATPVSALVAQGSDAGEATAEQ
jgi:uncharacterized protein